MATVITVEVSRKAAEGLWLEYRHSFESCRWSDPVEDSSVLRFQCHSRNKTKIKTFALSLSFCNSICLLECNVNHSTSSTSAELSCYTLFVHT